MAKKSMIQRDLKRVKLMNQYSKKRFQLKKELACPQPSDIRSTSTPESHTSEVAPPRPSDIRSALSLKDQFRISIKLQKLPRNSSPTRVHNRCFVTGRPKGFFRDFGLSRHVIREMAYNGLLPGITKASW
jgi:small subunit ribosomal protein S14